MNAAEPIGHTPMMQGTEREFSRELPIAEWKTYAKTYALTAEGRQLMKAAERDLCDAHETITALGRRIKLGRISVDGKRMLPVALRIGWVLDLLLRYSYPLPPWPGTWEIELMSCDERHTGSVSLTYFWTPLFWTPNPAHLQP
ncbi:MAG TPA: hypothetical protein VGO85_21640 [Caldimonas sp.]|nr:hypothetical protein [Caldimonas sp.]